MKYIKILKYILKNIIDFKYIIDVKEVNRPEHFPLVLDALYFDISLVCLIYVGSICHVILMSLVVNKFKVRRNCVVQVFGLHGLFCEWKDFYMETSPLPAKGYTF